MPSSSRSLDQRKTSNKRRSAAHSWQTRSYPEIALPAVPIPQPCTCYTKQQYLGAPAITFCRSRLKLPPAPPFSVGSPPAQLSASLRVLRFALALRVCWSGTLPTEVVARGKSLIVACSRAPLRKKVSRILAHRKKTDQFFPRSVAGPKTPFD